MTRREVKFREFKALLLDLDGTVYHGRRLIPGVLKTFDRLRKRGIRIFFVSNASMLTRRQLWEKLRRMGIGCRPEEVYNTAYSTAEYIRRHYPRARVYCITQGGLRRELQRAGVRVVDNEKATIVATGLDRRFNYKQMTIAFRALLNGAVFIASNVDRIYPTEEGLMPGSGTIAAALMYGSRLQPMVIGKPEPRLFNELLAHEKLKRNEVLVVGDNAETDGMAARRAGLQWALVLTGVTRRKDIRQLKEKAKPGWVLKNVNALEAILR